MNSSCPPAFITGIAHSTAFYTKCRLSDSSFILKASHRSVQLPLRGHRSRLVMQEASLENVTEEKTMEKSDSDVLKNVVLETETEDAASPSLELGNQALTSDSAEPTSAELPEAVELGSGTAPSLESTAQEEEHAEENAALETELENVAAPSLESDSQAAPLPDSVETVSDEAPEVAGTEIQSTSISVSTIEEEKDALNNVTLDTKTEDVKSVQTTSDEPVETVTSESQTVPSLEPTTEEEGAADAETETIAQDETEDQLKTDEEKEQESLPAPSRQERRRQWIRKKKVTVPMASLEVGQQHTGVVKKVVSYGAFIDIGAEKDGLLHISRMRDDFVRDSGEICKVGESLDVGIVSVDQEKGSFSLAIIIDGEMVGSRAENRDGGQQRKTRSRRAKMAWEDFTFDEKVFVTGKVKTITDFGAFVELDAPADGLVHISEISNERVSSVADILSVGQEVQVRIMSVDEKRNRIALSMRNLKEPEAHSRPRSRPRPQSQSHSRSQSRSQSMSQSISQPQGDEAVSKEEGSVLGDQPVFKTAFQLAWEKANALKNSK